MSWKPKPSASLDPAALDSLAHEDTGHTGPWCTESMKSSWRETILPKYPTTHGALMPILHELQDQYRCIPFQAMVEIATFLEIPPSEVLDTVSFYEEFHSEPVGRCVVGICQSIACEVCGHAALERQLRSKLDLEPHETDDEGRFTLLQLECLGSCDTAPVALFNDELLENLTMEQVDSVIDELRAIPIEQMDRANVREVVRRHGVTQHGRSPGNA